MDDDDDVVVDDDDESLMTMNVARMPAGGTCPHSSERYQNEEQPHVCEYHVGQLPFSPFAVDSLGSELSSPSQFPAVLVFG
eukprot:2415605-Amphidinium_carterae.1